MRSKLKLTQPIFPEVHAQFRIHDAVLEDGERFATAIKPSWLLQIGDIHHSA